MDRALQEAQRRAQADPDDAAARSAYGQQLLRLGRQAAALHELLASVRPAGREALPLELRRQLTVAGPDGEPLELALDLEAGPPLAQVVADLDDAHFPGALVLNAPECLPSEQVPRVLFGYPACSACLTPEGRQGAVECERCRGTGRIVEFTGYAEDVLDCDACGTTGEVPCDDCGGSGLEEPPDPAQVSACEHAWSLERVLARARLLRCQRCSLAALERAGQTHVACGACGWLACGCGS